MMGHNTLRPQPVHIYVGILQYLVTWQVHIVSNLVTKHGHVWKYCNLLWLNSAFRIIINGSWCYNKRALIFANYNSHLSTLYLFCFQTLICTVFFIDSFQDKHAIICVSSCYVRIYSHDYKLSHNQNKHGTFIYYSEHQPKKFQIKKKDLENNFNQVLNI